MPLKGYKHSDEAKQKIKLAQVGRPSRFPSEESKQKNRIAHIGKHHTEAAKQKIGKASIGRHLSEEAKQKIRLVATGRYHTETTKQKMRSSHLGKKLSEEHKQNIGAARTGHTVSQEARRKIGEAHKGMCHTEAAKQKMSLAQTGEKSIRWRGGNRGGYPPGFARIAKAIRLRDNGLCILCGCFEQSRKLKPAVHHIDCHKYNSDLLNLVAVCSTCHRKIHATVDSEQDYEIILSNWVRQKYGKGGTETWKLAWL